MTSIEQTKENAIRKFYAANHDAIDADEPIDASSWDDCEFSVDCMDHLVLTEEERAARLRDRITEGLWAFNARWLVCELNLSDSLIEPLEKMQAELCEDANEIMLRIVGDDLDQVIESASSDDGAGHFLATYDGEEYEVEVDGMTLYVYRTN